MLQLRLEEAVIPDVVVAVGLRKPPNFGGPDPSVARILVRNVIAVSNGEQSRKCCNLTAGTTRSGTGFTGNHGLIVSRSGSLQARLALGSVE